MNYRAILESAEPLTPETRCGYCLFPFGQNPAGRAGFHADHIVPRSKAKHLSNELTNLVWACLRCNLKKGDATHSIDPISNSSVPIFHPRQQAWTDHFLGHHTGKINGRTSRGRGTEARLEFNSEFVVVAARKKWARDGLWP